MKSSKNSAPDDSSSFKSGKRGFTLVITLALMVLLTILAVGLLSLSSVSLRSSSQAAALAEARTNARMALMIAIGELQKQMGPDQRVSASGAIIDPDSTKVVNPHWTGVWDSWQAGPNTSGADQKSDHSTIEDNLPTSPGMAPTYQTNRKDHFRSWLLSLNPEDLTVGNPVLTARDLTLTGELMPSKTATAVQLVSKGSLGTTASTTDYVNARLMKVQDPSTGNTSGRYGWWVGDESQKARIMDDSYNTSPATSNADKIARSQAPGSTGTKRVVGLESMTDDKELSKLPSLASLHLVSGATNQPEQQNFHSVTPFSNGVIADVREGGLKRDLSTLLEQKIVPIKLSDPNINAYSLYRFNTKDAWAKNVSGGGTTVPQECVPIQDLAAFYQLYDAVSPQATAVDSDRTGNKRGVQYSPSAQGGINGMHLLSTNYGTIGDDPIYRREYTAIYRQPKIIKMQFLLSLFSKKIVPAIPADRTNPTPNTHELLIGITPSITFWNPTNLPIMFQMNKIPNIGAQMLSFNDTPIQIKFHKTSGDNITDYTSIGQMTGGNPAINLYWAGVQPINLEPGEVKTCSLPFSGDLSALKSKYGYNGNWRGWNSNYFFKTDTWFVGFEVKPGWEPESFIQANICTTANANNGPNPIGAGSTDVRHVVNGRLRFKNTDKIQIDVGSGNASGIGWNNNSSFYQSYDDPGNYSPYQGDWDRYSTVVSMRGGAGTAFYQPLFSKGMTNGATSLLSAWRTGSSIIARSSTQAGWPFMHFGIMAGTETSEVSNAGFAGGRKFASRPFLHSSTMSSSPILDNNTGNDLYNFGWNWSVDLLNDVYEAPIQVTPTGSSYWGGGYTPESGTTHIIQQEIPVIPTISIAALSHARLGGWSISDQQSMPYSLMSATDSLRKRTMNRAIGYGGLRPYTLQAIGNSYAHPQIPADKTYNNKDTVNQTNVSRTFNLPDGAFKETFADHSYLANKAIWDEFFFSSISPQRGPVKVFNSTGREALDVANEFFFPAAGVASKPLPNRRIKPYTANLDNSKLTTLFALKDIFTDGLADKIAANLMVQGAFNINSTSVDAWRIFFSSLKGKPVAYLSSAAAMAGNDPSLATTSGTPVGQMGLTGGTPYSGSPTSPRDANQWTSWRELTDTEIDELAVAMVKQVKLRGPFLSLSEFVNRRLDPDNLTLAVKGALQSALDDYPAVSINKPFWEVGSKRKFSAAELASMIPAFPLAAQGPIAYGSAAYIDQADILRGLAEQLIPFLRIKETKPTDTLRCAHAWTKNETWLP